MKRTWKSIIAIVLVLSMLSVPVLADDNISKFLKKAETLITMIQTFYYKDVKVTDVMDGALKGMFSALDKNSTYYNKEEFAKFNEQISGNFVGVGMYIDTKDGYIHVISPIEGTSAHRGGVQPGDLVVTIDGKTTLNMPEDTAISLIRGAKNTKVKLGIKREGVAETLTIELVRELIKINPITHEILPGNIGYIRISQFNENTNENITKVFSEFKTKNIDGIIVDVRDNPGGILEQVVAVCQQLIPKGPIAHIQSKGKIIETHSSTLEKAPFKIVMLVNGGSASASEIMAGAIKESGVGKLVGTKTYGKGTVQAVRGLSDGTGFKITSANYLTPKGFSLDGVGITPDFEVQNTKTDLSREYADIVGLKPIKLKTVSLEVYGVQQRLKALGYKVSAPDGVFGLGTQAAVKQFQKDNKLKVDGSVDADDIKLLNDKFNSFMNSKDAQMDKALEEIKKMIAQ